MHRFLPHIGVTGGPFQGFGTSSFHLCCPLWIIVCKFRPTLKLFSVFLIVQFVMSFVRKVSRLSEVASLFFLTSPDRFFDEAPSAFHNELHTFLKCKTEFQNGEGSN